ncbi:MAG: molybdenum cofactor guanylyltransferase [Spirochaetaceae bacterium]|jgi:molybdopterin-guanine dinucleotide biosynthesis protein A|nr:molybdenum cofactor guanylyltransferase [Spirochaetaceae bacterium]
MVMGSALILAGGQGKRMGYDKKKLALGGEVVIESLITRLKVLFPEVLVSSNNPFPHDQVVVLKDELGSGPLAGIYRGLTYCRSDYLYVVACDMPFISLDYIRYMQEAIREKSVDACVTRRPDGFYEPFNAFFNKSCLPLLHEALVNHTYKISLFLDRLGLHILDASTLREFKLEELFFNINTPADLPQRI